MSCFRALEAMGPLQIRALSGATKKPMERNFTPNFSTGMIRSRLSSLREAGRTSSQPNILGIEGPKMSASMRPTDAPPLARATARLTARVDLPTPPLPEATAMMFFTPGSRGRSMSWINFTAMFPLMSAAGPRFRRMASSARVTTSGIAGSSERWKTSVKLIFCPAILISWTMFRATISWLLPG